MHVYRHYTSPEGQNLSRSTSSYGNNAMRLSVVTNPRDLMTLKTDWEDLLSCALNKSFFLSHEWVYAAQQVFHEKDTLHIIIVRNSEGRLIGAAPLVITEHRYRFVPVVKISFFKNIHNPENDFILAAETAEACLRRIIDHLLTFTGWQFIDLSKVQVGSFTAFFLDNILKESRFFSGTKDNIESPYIPINCGWDVFWNSKSQKFRKGMRNKINRIKRHGEYAVEKVYIGNSKMKELAEVQNISAKSWKKEIGMDLESRAVDWQFYQRFCDALGPMGFVQAYFLKIGGNSIAFEFHIVHQNTSYPIRADFDARYKELSPGSILEYEIIKTLFQEKIVAEYNSCGHNYFYLLNWTDKTRKHKNFEVFQNSLKTMSLYCLEYKILVLLRKMRINILLKKILSFMNKEKV